MIILLQSHCPPCFSSNMPSMCLLPGFAFGLLQLGSALPAGSAQLAHALPSDPFTCHTSGCLMHPVKSQPLSDSSVLHCLISFLWYLQILSIYDYYLSFSLGRKPLEYEDFITVVYCFSICDRHSKL